MNEIGFTYMETLSEMNRDMRHVGFGEITNNLIQIQGTEKQKENWKSRLRLIKMMEFGIYWMVEIHANFDDEVYHEMKGHMLSTIFCEQSQQKTKAY